MRASLGGVCYSHVYAVSETWKLNRFEAQWAASRSTLVSNYPECLGLFQEAVQVAALPKAPNLKRGKKRKKKGKLDGGLKRRKGIDGRALESPNKRRSKHPVGMHFRTRVHPHITPPHTGELCDGILVVDSGSTCARCGYFSKWRHNVKRHIENKRCGPGSVAQDKGPLPQAPIQHATIAKKHSGKKRPTVEVSQEEPRGSKKMPSEAPQEARGANE